MKPWGFLPMPFPGPPVPGGLLFGDNKEEKDKEGDEEKVDTDFRSKMESEGFDPDLVKMGIKVAKNHMRSPEEAFKIGEEYIRSMAK